MFVFSLITRVVHIITSGVSVGGLGGGARRRNFH